MIYLVVVDDRGAFGVQCRFDAALCVLVVDQEREQAKLLGLYRR